jgi:hypothetical protein
MDVHVMDEFVGRDKFQTWDTLAAAHSGASGDQNLTGLAAGGDTDPDPFAIGLGILGILFAGGAYLEARRQREFQERHTRDQFRRAWFEARRTLLHARRVIEEFATYVEEDDFGTRDFLFGRVRLQIDVGRAAQLRRLHGNAHNTAQHLADNLDEIANHLDAQYQPLIDSLDRRLREIVELPPDYRALVRTARDVLTEYETLIGDIGRREGFDQDA